MDLAKKLKDQHKDSFPYHTLPAYHYEQLKKGLVCPDCRTLTLTLHKRTFRCSGCGYEESLSSTIKRNAEEFKLLFPDVPLNSRTLYHWCGEAILL